MKDVVTYWFIAVFKRAMQLASTGWYVTFLVIEPN